MTQASTGDWEFAIVLPLGAVAAQLQKIEAQLRLLNMKALNFARERDGHPLLAVVEGRLEQIGETLDSVASLVCDIQADLTPRRTKVSHLTVDEESPAPAARRGRQDRLPSGDTDRPPGPSRKPHPDRDD